MTTTGCTIWAGCNAAMCLSGAAACSCRPSRCWLAYREPSGAGYGSASYCGNSAEPSRHCANTVSSWARGAMARRAWCRRRYRDLDGYGGGGAGYLVSMAMAAAAADVVGIAAVWRPSRPPAARRVLVGSERYGALGQSRTMYDGLDKPLAASTLEPILQVFSWLRRGVA